MRYNAMGIVEEAYRLWEMPGFGSNIERLAAEDYRAGNRMSMKFYIEATRRKGMLRRDKREYACPNAVAPALTRILLRKHPEYEGSIVQRSSRVDRIFDDERTIAELEAA